ncbi:MAG TPA: response regulator [Pirellulales bacterium]|nr:response regulator [Pirellulales bacterium]
MDYPATYRAKAAAADPSAAAFAFSWASMKTLRVLIIEDHRDTAAMLAQWVTTAGHDVKICYTGFQAEQALPGYRPDVVLLDIGLPDMNGWELAPLLRRENSSLMVVAVTAYQTWEDRRKSKDAGIDLHLGKPVHRKNVLRLLDTAAAG